MEYYLREKYKSFNSSTYSTLYEGDGTSFWVESRTGGPDILYRMMYSDLWNLSEDLKSVKVEELCKKNKWEF